MRSSVGVHGDPLPQALMLSDAFEGIEDAVYVKSPDGRYLMANPAAAAAAGLDREVLIGKSDRELFPESWRELRAVDEQVLRDGVPRTVEEAIAVDGEVRVFLSAKAPLMDAGGEVLGIIGVSTDITDRKSGEQDVRSREAMLAEAQSIARVGSWSWDFARDEAIWSDELYRIFGVDPDTWVPSFERFLDVIHPDDSQRVSRILDESIRGGADFEVEFKIMRADDAVRTLHVRGRVVADPAGEPIRLVGACVDVTDDRADAGRFAGGEALLGAAEQLVHAGSFHWSRTTGAITWSEGLKRLLEVDPATATDTPRLDDLLDRLLPDDRTAMSAALERVADTRGADRGVFRSIRSDGIRWLEAEMAYVETPGPLAGRIVCGCRDVTDHALEVLQLEDRLAEARERALHDPLTGLANRDLAFDRLDHAWVLARRRDEDLAVLFLDVDDFKAVNDRWGHAVGDEVLAGVADRLRRSARVSDTVARIGGDEFLVVCELGDRPFKGREAAERFTSAFEEPIRCASATVPVTVSVGVSSLAGRKLKRSRQLVGEADDAMYTAKARGPGRFALRGDRGGTRRQP